MVVNSSGDLYSCGRNDYGQLGRTVADSFKEPLGIVGVVSGVTLASCGKQVYGRNSFVIGTGKTLWSWGEGAYYVLGNGLTDNVLSPEEIGSGIDWDFVYAGKAGVIAVGNAEPPPIFWTNFIGQTETLA